jgi:hypothetical protein
MTGWLIKAAIAAVLFVGSLVGGLAATGRLNHEGTANIPLLRSLFPAPPAAASSEAGGEHADGTTPGQAAPADALAAPNGESRPADANHAQPPQGDTAPRRRKTGRSLFEGDDKDKGTAKGAHGEDAAAADASPHDAKAEAEKPEHGTSGAAAAVPATAMRTPEGDFARVEQALANERSPYKPGELFRFDGLPAGLTPAQINEAWQRVQGAMTEIERRKVALDLQEQQLRELNEDISRRQASLGKERVEIEQMHRDLDAKIERFKDQVKLVRNDEVAALKRNAQTLASFEPAKAAELLEAQWKTEKGQDEVLKLLEFMEKDAVNAILDALPKELTNDLLKKRLRVSKEATAPAKAR